MSTEKNPVIDTRSERVIPLYKDAKTAALEDAIAKAKPNPWTRSMFLASLKTNCLDQYSCFLALLLPAHCYLLLLHQRL
jgi:hypothetical protein